MKLPHVLPPGFECRPLSQLCWFGIGALPPDLTGTPDDFAALWALRPAEFARIRMFGRLVPTPRWQQAFGHDYRFSGVTSSSLPTPQLLTPLLDHARDTLDPRLNGILVNWYDGELDHYIGPHRDKTTGLIAGAPIVVISFGEPRIFRLRLSPAPDDTAEATQDHRFDFLTGHGTVFVLPWETNLRFTHEVPKMEGARGKRISITIRAFTE